MRRSRVNGTLCLITIALAIVASIRVSSAEPPTSPNSPSASSSASSDPLMDELKSKVEEGTKLFADGHVRDAIERWQGIARSVGEERGYRLLFNIGIAHEQLGDATSAADSYERFLAQIDRRRSHSGTPPYELPSDIGTYENEARSRLAKMKERYGRLRPIVAAGRTGLLKVDGTSGVAGTTYYLSPGAHSVTFEAGTSREETRSIDVPRGQLVEVTLDAIAAPSATASAVAPPIVTKMRERPFSAGWLGLAAGVTVASVAIPLVLRSNALSTYDRVTSPTTLRRERQDAANTYEQQVRTYEMSWAIPAVLGAATGALTSWYFFGTREVEQRSAATVRIDTSRHATMAVISSSW
ncbi:MAG: hypothetical protein U0165_09545 [Polyangiaceae bacterium]